MAEQIDNAAITDPGPGVHVVVHPDPLRAGRMVAEALGGLLVDQPMLAESAVAQRLRLPEARANRKRLDELENAARGLAGATYESDRDLVSRGPDLQRIARRRLLDPATSLALHRLARELRSLEAAIERTERAALGPEALAAPDDDDGTATARRAAAAAVRAEEAAVVDARQAVDLLPVTVTDEDEDADGSADATAPLVRSTRPAARDEGGERDDDPEGTDRPERPLDRGDDSVLLPAALFCLIGVLPMFVVLLCGFSAWVAFVAVVLGTIVAAVCRYSIKTEVRLAQARAEAAGPDIRTGGPTVTERQRRLHAADEAEGRLLIAQRAWAAVAGPDADPHAPEFFGRSAATAEEPALDDRPLAPGLAAARRALASVHRDLRATWRVTWAELGRVAPPPDEAVVDLMLADLRETAPDPLEAEALLAAVAEAEHRLDQRSILAAAFDGDELRTLRSQAPDADDLDDRPLVLVMPFAELSPKRQLRLRRQLDEIGPDLTIIVAVHASNDVPSVPATA